MLKNNLKLRILGDLNKFPKKLKNSLNEAIKLTSKNNKLQINLALNYGSKSELINAFKLSKSIPIQVAGNDTVEGRYRLSINRTGGSFL